MIHHATELKPQTDHWAVSWTGDVLPKSLGRPSMVLVQLQEDGNQARVGITPEEAELMAQKLIKFAQQARVANQS